VEKKVSNKRAFEKVKRVELCKDTSDGGINMIDIFDMQNSFLLMWVTKLYNSYESVWSCIPKYWYNKLGEKLSVLESSVTCRDFIGMELIKSVFWKRVLSTWILNNKSSQVSAEEVALVDIYSQVLWNNRFIVYKRTPLMILDCIKAGIIRVGDILKQKNIINYEDYVCKLDTSPNRLLEYNALVNSVPQVWKEKLVREANPNQTTGNLKICFRDVPVQSFTGKLYRTMLVNDTTSIVCAVKFWERKFGVHLTNWHWNIADQCTKEVRLKVLHWKIMHNIFPTNIMLNKMSIRVSNQCSYCNQVDFLEHFFYDCKYIKQLWVEVKKLIVCNTGNNVDLNITDVLFGCKRPYLGSKVCTYVNHLILIAKMCISKVKYGKKTHIIILFENEVNIRNITF
jgi:hypothetical protein